MHSLEYLVHASGSQTEGDLARMNYYIKRTLQAVFTFWATITATFALIKWMPGGPMDWIMVRLLGAGGVGGTTPQSLDPAAMERFRQLAKTYVNVDPDTPLYVQYFDYVSAVLQGDFGKSIIEQAPVWDVLGPAIPWTVFIGAISIFISFVTRVVVGAVLAYKEGSTFDFVSTSALIWIGAIPYFLVAIWMLYVFSYQLQWFPTAGRMNYFVDPGLNYPFIAGLFAHAALPIISLAWATFGAGAISMRANSIQVLGEDYMRVGKLRGLTTKRLTLRYVARNAILPMYTGLIIGIGYIFGGSIILESIFEYKGVGWYMFRGIEARDYPLLMGGFILITASVVVALMVADFTYSWIDPRIQTGDKDNAF